MRKLETLGERRIIEIIQSQLDPMPEMSIPFGDDVSACEVKEGDLAVLKADMLVGRTDVPKGMSLWQAARKAVVMSMSDFAAKGVAPTAVLVSLGLPRHLTEKNIVKIGAGLNAGAREYGAYIIGGDTGEDSDLVISVSLFGTLRKGKPMLRSGAKPGDVLAVTGYFGKASAGLKILVEDLKISERISRILVKSVLMPHARVREGLALRETGVVTSAIDSSDGLAWSLHEIAKASRVGFVVNSLPIAREVETFAEITGLNSLELALYGGEEYELVLTVNPRFWHKTARAVENLGGRLYRIGEVTATETLLLKENEKEMLIEPRGYEHFTPWDR